MNWEVNYTSNSKQEMITWVQKHQGLKVDTWFESNMYPFPDDMTATITLTKEQVEFEIKSITEGDTYGYRLHK